MRIEAAPSKDFFIVMLTRDIPIEKAITELVDNSVDGATSVNRNKDYLNFWVKIEVNKDFFKISDNCGGISVETAREYAFRFGRPIDAPDTDYSIGRFGVGMKRALFRLGSQFSIYSNTRDSSFEIEVDVGKWSKSKKWEFSFSKLSEDVEISSTEIGTIIQVSKLHTTASDIFDLGNFISGLKKEIQSRNEISMEKGLSIYINEEKLNVIPSQLYLSKDIKPAYFAMDINGVNVKIYAGIADREPSKAGWYIFCNDRLIIEADQSGITGWGNGHAAFHNNVAWFRGYVYFESKDAMKLPWNTMKSGIDTENEIYRATKLQMINMMKTVTSFLNKVAEEKDEDESNLRGAILQTVAVKVKDIDVKKLKLEKVMTVPKITKSAPKTKKISYDKSILEVEKVQKVLQVNTLKEIGEKTFEYFLAMECED